MQGYIAFYSHFVKKNVQASIFLAQFSLDQVIPYLNSISILLDLLELQGLIKKHDKLWGAQFHHDGIEWDCWKWDFQSLLCRYLFH
jgi:hypothetical protein